MSTMMSLSLCARVTLDMHSLNNEGTEGNQQMTRMVHILDQEGNRQVVNAISGDMLKHILVEHLTPLLQEGNQPVSAFAKQLHPDRILPDPGFREFVKGNNGGNSAILRYMLEHCAVTDIAGTLFAEKAAARKSCAEFGWVVGLPDRTVTEQYFHVKYDPQSREKGAGGESVEGRQAIFHRPASSGIYALICNLDLYRIGLNDITREYDVSVSDRTVRARAVIQALAATLLKPSGAQRNTQSPHVLNCQGIVAWSANSLPAPALSPLKDGYEAQIEECVASLNRIAPGALHAQRFNSMAEGVALLTGLAGRLETSGG
jgi:CRISPR-associated protein Cst2